VDKLKSFLGSESELSGELKSNGILRMDGVLTGTLHADQVFLTEKALVKGEIIARRIIVYGKAEGILRADELVEIRPRGTVNGDIYAKKFLVMAGGEFNGKIEMNSEPE
jgi:cytoskeletal protein CcmA (bactofilin family)